MTTPWPEPKTKRDPVIEQLMSQVFEAVGVVREVRNRNSIAPKIELTAVISAKDESTAALLKAGAEIIRDQANVSELSVGVNLAKPKFCAAGASTTFTVYVPLEGKIDRKAEVERTKKELEKARGQIAQSEAQLANEEFRKRKPDLAREIEEKAAALRAKVAELEAHLKELDA
jgi:valyl-tRNA synthetase